MCGTFWGRVSMEKLKVPPIRSVIIGALPICVAFLVWVTSPDYIELLWINDLGRMMIAGCVVWMSIGIFVMKQMINFDF